MTRQREADLNAHYDNLHYYSPLDAHTFLRLCQAVDVELQDPILDVGCGDGRLARRNPSLRVDGVDYNEKRAKAAGAVHADLYDFLANADQKWALVVMVEVLEHLEEPHTAIDLARGVADVGVVATVPIDLPYVAHLSVWKNHAAVVADLKPDRAASMGAHSVLYWEPKT